MSLFPALGGVCPPQGTGHLSQDTPESPSTGRGARDTAQLCPRSLGCAQPTADDGIAGGAPATCSSLPSGTWHPSGSLLPSPSPPADALNSAQRAEADPASRVTGGSAVRSANRPGRVAGPWAAPGTSPLACGRDPLNCPQCSCVHRALADLHVLQQTQVAASCRPERSPWRHGRGTESLSASLPGAQGFVTAKLPLWGHCYDAACEHTHTHPAQEETLSSPRRPPSPRPAVDPQSPDLRGWENLFSSLWTSKLCRFLGAPFWGRIKAFWHFF